MDGDTDQRLGGSVEQKGARWHGDTGTWGDAERMTSWRAGKLTGGQGNDAEGQGQGWG